MALDGYVSPLLRMAVFRRLNPNFRMSFNVVPIEDAFPETSLQSPPDCPQPPTHAVVCEIAFPDGSSITAPREIDLVELGRDRKWHPIIQTPENMAKMETKAMGRALTRAGIPQKDAELQTLMRWTVALDGRPIAREAAPLPSPVTRVIDRATGEILDEASPGLTTGFATRPDEVDSPDADDETVTPLQELVGRLMELDGVTKAKVAKWGREQGISNIMQTPPDRIDEVNEYLTKEGLT